MAQQAEGHPSATLGARMFKKREADGETVLIGGLPGCLFFIFILLLLGYWLIVAAASLLEYVFSNPAESAGSFIAIVTTGWLLILLSEKLNEIENTKTFFKSLGIDSYRFWKTSIEYSIASIPKRTGGSRQLQIPNKELKALQTQLAVNIEKTLGKEVHQCANAYVRGRSTVTNTIPHLGAKVIIKLDVKNFFPSVSSEHIGPWLDQFVAKLARKNYAKLTKRLKDLILFENQLPQGAPTSPILSNLVLLKFDIAMQRMAFANGARYTRYADDITLSLRVDKKSSVGTLIKLTRVILARSGFRLNETEKKIVVLRPHQHQQICGITINSGRPTISRRQRRELRAAAHAISKGKETSYTTSQLSGWLSYVSHIQKYELPKPRKATAIPGRVRPIAQEP
jgi:RNA-directed DNA polymerase